MPASDSITIRAQGKAVGAVRDGVFVKNVRSSVHFLQRPPAICLTRSRWKTPKKPGRTAGRNL